MRISQTYLNKGERFYKRKKKTDLRKASDYHGIYLRLSALQQHPSRCMPKPKTFKLHVFQKKTQYPKSLTEYNHKELHTRVRNRYYTGTYHKT